MDIKEVYKTCDFVLENLRSSKPYVTPCPNCYVCLCKNDQIKE